MLFLFLKLKHYVLLSLLYLLSLIYFYSRKIIFLPNWIILNLLYSIFSIERVRTEIKQDIFLSPPNLALFKISYFNEKNNSTIKTACRASYQCSGGWMFRPTFLFISPQDLRICNKNNCSSSYFSFTVIKTSFYIFPSRETF